MTTMNRYEQARALVKLWVYLDDEAAQAARDCDGEKVDELHRRKRRIEHQLADVKVGRRLWGEG